MKIDFDDLIFWSVIIVCYGICFALLILAIMGKIHGDDIKLPFLMPMQISPYMTIMLPMN